MNLVVTRAERYDMKPSLFTDDDEFGIDVLICKLFVCISIQSYDRLYDSLSHDAMRCSIMVDSKPCSSAKPIP